MRIYFSLICIGLLALITLCKASIHQLTDENFSTLVKKEDEWLIDFYADWCGYCKRLEPKFLAADRLLSKIENNNVKLGWVNIEDNPGLAARFFISRLPTVVHIKDHQVRIVKRIQRDADIVNFITFEEWRNVDPKSSLMSPFSPFGKMVGFTGKVVKKLSSYSPWTMIGILTGFLICAISLPIILTKKQQQFVKNKDDPIQNTSKKNTALRARNKSKRID
ncbi:thioredoxin-like protein [Cokeromyces recurvatus]|uniref:thioredoxin-like protein n=1 Tax=Cokeromyces recurvatus TaxID=90255 RepID=UPI00221F65FA|nr:thioredoxin-like protein [Cokeromyces recurvatus]KAI7899236.1 thioredoxin-like protein [Cokeromyces recurvatus]